MASITYHLLAEQTPEIVKSVEENKREFKVGLDLTLGYPGVINYNIRFHYSLLFAEYTKGFANSFSDASNFDSIIDNPEEGISGSQITIGLGTKNASLNYVNGTTNCFTRVPDPSGKLKNWDYHGVTLRKQSGLFFYEIGWLWGDEEVYRSELFFAEIGIGFSIKF